MAFSAQTFADIKAAEFREHDIQNYQIVILVRSETQAKSAVARDLDRVAFVVEAIAQGNGHRLIVFYDEHLAHGR